MEGISRQDRIVGAIMGTLIGDALGVGPHWYKSWRPLKADYGAWIDDYVAPLPHRYHAGLQPGDYSQTGQVFVLMLESMAECGEYSEPDFTRRLDGLLASIDGTPFSGRYTDVAMREVWHTRQAGLDWSAAGSFADTAEAAIRGVILAARYSDDLHVAKEKLLSNIRLTHQDPFVAGQSVALNLNLCALLQGVRLGQVTAVMLALGSPPGLRPTLTVEAPRPHALDIPEKWVKMPHITWGLDVTWLGPAAASDDPAFVPKSNFIDALMLLRDEHIAARRREIKIEPAQAVCELFGVHCTLGMVMPAAYYYVSRFEDDFEKAVLTAVNMLGNNMACATLTGALSGAIVGISHIPERFITGLHDGERILALAEQVADVTLRAG